MLAVVAVVLHSGFGYYYCPSSLGFGGDKPALTALFPFLMPLDELQQPKQKRIKIISWD